tara:strand:+ start:7468 stop:8199 length:732 start_codon:yes stop_codon:yes gene_type:complete
MSKKLIKLVFKKVEEEIGPSRKTQKAKYLSVLLLENHGYPISERRLRDYYTNYIEKEETNNEALRPQLIEPLCKYLGYNNYAGFVLAHPSELEVSSSEEEEEREIVEEGKKGFWEDYKDRIVLISSAIAISVLIYFGFIKEEQNCMVWRRDHYEQTICSGDSNEKPLEELILKRFRKVVVRDSLIKRKANNQELWYDKSNGHVEFFTYHGEHPLNNKPLKGVTDYIFKTYVLDKMNDSINIDP